MIVVLFVGFASVIVEGQNRREMVPAMFIFGDSLIDNGNNNNLPSFAKANYFPYGIDFNGGPTGRFNNGYTMVDEIGHLHLHTLSFFFNLFWDIIADFKFIRPYRNEIYLFAAITFIYMLHSFMYFTSLLT